MGSVSKRIGEAAAVTALLGAGAFGLALLTVLMIGGIVALHSLFLALLVWVGNIALAKVFGLAMLPFKKDCIIGLGLVAFRRLYVSLFRLCPPLTPAVTR